MTSNKLSILVPTATRCGPVALIADPDALNALGEHPDAPRPCLKDKQFLQYVADRRGYVLPESVKWSDLSIPTRGRLIDCWYLYLDSVGKPERDAKTDWDSRKKWLIENIFAKDERY